MLLFFVTATAYNPGTCLLAFRVIILFGGHIV